MSAVDDYFEGLDPSARAEFERIRTIATRTVRDVEEGTSYGMAALRYRNKPLIGFRAAKGHLSIFPFSSEVVEEASARLTGFDLSKGTIRFTVGSPLPEEAVREVVRLRVREIEEGR